MNTYALRQMEIGGPETMNWTPVEVPVTEIAEEASTPVLKGKTVPYLLHRACCTGKTAAKILIFLALGATGLWTFVDLSKNVIASFRGE